VDIVTAASVCLLNEPLMVGLGHGGHMREVAFERCIASTFVW
jgi:hypothetical protein